MSLRSRSQKRRNRKKRARYVAGYNFAAGKILRGEMTPAQLENAVFADCDCIYCSGVYQAIVRLIRLGACEDDRE